MSIKKLLLCVAAMAIAMTAFASSAMAATDGVIKDTNGTIITPGTELKAKGWAKFTSFGAGIECHVTATIKATGTEGKTGEVTSFAPVTSTCHGTGTGFAGCLVTTDTVGGLPYAVTATPTDLDVTGLIAIANTFSGCTSGITGLNLAFTAITLKPLKTGTAPVTNTDQHLGTTAATGAGAEPITGFELSGEATAELLPSKVKLAVETFGELEIEGVNRCTYKLTS